MLMRTSVGFLCIATLGFANGRFAAHEPSATTPTGPEASSSSIPRPLQELSAASQGSSADPEIQRREYRVLATKKTSTMQKEMSEAADAGFRFEGVMGGGTAFGGSEVVMVMSRHPELQGKPRYEYKLLATRKTSTMQKELQETGDAGFEYRGQTVFETLFGGKEVVVILERDREATPTRHEYKLLATSKTSTMQKELLEAGEAGYDFVGLTVGETALGGAEVVTILRRRVDQ